MQWDFCIERRVMAFLRNKNREKFTVIDNTAIMDNNLSLKALGLLVKLLSMPDNWEFSENGLEKAFNKDGQTSIRSGLKELENFGYLKRYKARDEKGRITKIVWDITENPHVENPSMDNPSLDNRPQYNTNRINNLNNKVCKKEPAHKYGMYKNVLLTDEELEKLKEEFPDWQARIDRLSEYMESSGKRYKSHIATIRAWARKDKKEEGDYSFDVDEAVKMMYMNSAGG